MALSNTGITTTIVKNALSESINNVGGLCSSNNINVWSKWKPISLNAVTLTYSLLKANNFGISIVSATTPANLLTQVQSNGSGLGYIYNKPQGGASSPYRLGDFRYYNHSAGIPIYSHYKEGDTENIGNVATTYSVTLDGIETIDTGDDTSETSQTAGIGKSDIYPSGLNRGALLTNGTKSAWSVGTIPYGNSAWQQLKGGTVTCLEFLTNVATGQTSVNHTMQSTDRFYALPYGLHTITLSNSTPAGSKDAFCQGRCDLSTDRKSVSYRLRFSSMGDVYAGGTLSNVWFILSDDYNGSNQISRIKIADSLHLGTEETTSYYTGILSSPSAMSQCYVIAMWNGSVKWRTTPMEIVDPT